MSYGILVDTTKCRGCEQCVLACAASHGTAAPQTIQEKVLNRDGLSAYRLTDVRDISPGHFAKISCMHCVDPSCVSACLVGGITKTNEGPVVYDREKCIGCRYCMLACPFHIPRYEWDKIVPYMAKCDMCFDRLNKGELPACVDACPEKAIKFGDREKLLTEAQTAIKNKSDLYINHVWGAKEFGGTSILYISDVDLSALGWPEPIPASIPSLTEPLIHTTPIIGMTVAGALLAINWTVKRRIKIASEDNQKGSESNGAEKKSHE